MTTEFKIGEFVTPLVKSKKYELGEHRREVGEYYEIKSINQHNNWIRLADNTSTDDGIGWMRFEDVKRKEERKENYAYLVKLFKKLGIT
ncbi:MAG: hypothetical protein AABY22_33250 [Nanoarchaeota archaeon]